MEINENIRLWYDLETTGVGNDDQIYDFACLIENLETKKIMQWQVYMCPSIKMNYRALQVAQLTEFQIYNLPERTNGEKNIISLIVKLASRGKIELCGYNSNVFDKRFMEKLFIKYNLDIYDYCIINTYSDCKNIVSHSGLQKSMGLDNKKLTTVATYFNVEEQKAHSALADTIMTYKVYLKTKNWILNNLDEVPIKQREKLLQGLR